eukprot:9056103-Pyramimonas_sp.AAC.1
MNEFPAEQPPQEPVDGGSEEGDELSPLDGGSEAVDEQGAGQPRTAFTRRLQPADVEMVGDACSGVGLGEVLDAAGLRHPEHTPERKKTVAPDEQDDPDPIALQGEIDRVTGVIEAAAENGGTVDEIGLQMAELYKGALLDKMRSLKGHHPDTPLKTDSEPSEEDKMWEKYRQNGFNFSCKGKQGNPMGGRWQRAVKKPDLKNKYQAAQAAGQEAMTKFRREWCEGQYTEYIEKRSKVESRKQEFFKTAVYLSIGRIAWLEGGGQAGMRAAVKYMAKAMIHGGKWVVYDDMTEQVKALYVQQGFNDVVATEWKKHTEWLGAPKAAPSL